MIVNTEWIRIENKDRNKICVGGILYFIFNSHRIIYVATLVQTLVLNLGGMKKIINIKVWLGWIYFFSLHVYK